MDKNYHTDVLSWSDGLPHKIGPLTLLHAATTQHGFGPTGQCSITTDHGTDYQMDWPYAEAIAFAIAPSSHLWGAANSDRELQHGTGHRVGWLRLYVVREGLEMERMGPWRERSHGHFQIARIITEARVGEKVLFKNGERGPDYRREAFRIGGGAARKDTRSSFLKCAQTLAAQLHPNLPKIWGVEARARFEAADLLIEKHYPELLAEYELEGACDDDA